VGKSINFEVLHPKFYIRYYKFSHLISVRLSRKARYRRQDPGDTQVFCIVASEERKQVQEQELSKVQVQHAKVAST